MDSARVSFVLVRPARPANVAAACRALKNMGFRDLRIVEPPGGMNDESTRALAYGAWDVLDGAVASASLSDAVADCSVVAATSGRGAAEARTPRALAAEAGLLAGPGRLAVVFGPEAAGLTGDERALCHVHVRIPTDAAHPSLNLAQAVLVVAYELHLARAAEEQPSSPARPTTGELEAVLDHVRASLLGIGFLNPDNPDAVMAELRALLWRAAPSPRELTLLRGMARQVAWAGGTIETRRALLDNPLAKGSHHE